MKKFKNHTLTQYIEVLSKKEPTPGGGSVAALTASLALGLLMMVANYSIGKSSSKRIENKMAKTLKQAEVLRDRFVELIDLDAEAYMAIVKARKGTAKQKLAAKKKAKSVPLEMCKLCHKAIELTPFLVESGNKYLLSDVEVAIELLEAAYNSALINVKVNS